MKKYENILLTFIALLFCFGLSYLNLIWYLDGAPAWIDGTLDANHAKLLAFGYTNNEQSRLFQFYIPEFIHQISGVNIQDSYKIQRFFFYGLAFFVLFQFSQKWFSKTLSILILLLFAFYIMPNTYQNHLQESAGLMCFSFFLSIYFIESKKDYLYAITLFIGSINNETMLFVPAIYFLYHFENFNTLNKIIVNTLKYSLPAILIVLAIRIYTIDRPHLGGAYHLKENLGQLLRLFSVYNIFWFTPLIIYRQMPKFFQRAYLSVPLFIFPHMITGIIYETRQMLPLAIIILPSVAFLFCIISEELLPPSFKNNMLYDLIRIKD